MSGLRKAKQYDWKDSNLALFGSDTEKSVKKSSAETEPAWDGAGKEPGLQIWRIEQFTVKSWAKEDYGKFYDGDSYIILNTYKEDDSDALNYDVHFWIGKNSSQDEYGTAAYKTVELDTLLDDKAVQHREVMGHESKLFQNYFDTLATMKGGVATGFRHVKPEEYPARLLCLSGKRRNIQVKEVPRCKSRLTSDDVFILDLGLKAFQWNGSNANKDERFKAAQFLQQMESERGGCRTVVLDEGSGNPEFFDNLDEEDETEDDVDGSQKAIFRVSCDSGSVEFSEVKSGDITEEDLGTFDSGDVYLIYLGQELIVWVGSGASVAEKKNAIAYGHKFLQDKDPRACITIMKEGMKFRGFYN